MRDLALREGMTADSEELLTTGEAARLLGTSRQHVVDLCNQGLLPYTTVGTHRRIARRDVELAQATAHRLSRDQRRSLWLSAAIAGKLVTSPSEVIAQAKRNLVGLQAAHPRGQARVWLQQWELLLDGSVERIIEALTSRATYAREMRQNSPFAGVLSAREREQVLAAFTAATGEGRSR